MQQTKEGEMMKEKGITLIVLVITIIVLLILSGVSIAMITGENGIIKQTHYAKEETIKASEKEAIELNVINYEFNKSKDYLIGISLYDKTVENSLIWDVIITKNPSKTYGTNWQYISKNTEIKDYGKTKNEWVVNYETGEIVELDDYTRLTHGENLGVKDGLIFNVDPSIIENTDIEDLKNGNTEILGQNVELMNFNWNEQSGLTSKKFNFDGTNDYIKVQFDNKEKKEALAQKGFTFEYYGRVSEGKSYNEKNEEIDGSFNGIFCYWNGNEKQQAKFRFGMDTYKTDTIHIRWNAGMAQNAPSDYSNEEEVPWNIAYPIQEFQYGDEIYYTIVLDTEKEVEKDGEKYYKATLYVNGKKLYEGNYNKKQWENFINEHLENSKYFCIGRSSMSNEGWWHYTKLNTYACRLYNKPLTENEVKNNYDKSVAYHESIK